MARSKTGYAGKTPSVVIKSRRNHSPSLSDGSASSLHRTSSKPASSSSKKIKKSPLMKGPNRNNKKRKLPSNSSDASSSENVNDNEDDSEDSSEEEDGDDEQPETIAPSYGREKKVRRKAGRRNGPSLLNSQKRWKLAKTGYESGDSLSSVSSVSFEDSTNSDDEYQGVDEVCDADDEELEVEKLEEEMILESEYEREAMPNGRVGLTDDWMGLDDLESRPLYSAGSFFDDEHLLLHHGPTETVVEANSTSEAANTHTPAPRRVHFAESDDSDSDKTTDDELLSDFLQQDSLDPDLRRMIENDCEPMIRPRSPHDVLVNNDFYELPGNIYHVEDDTSVGSSSGYETDGGETTDEEDYPHAATITHPRSILRRDSSVSLSADDEEPSLNSQPLRRRGPLRGTFVADPHKPVAVVAPDGKQLILIPPYASSQHDWLKSANSSLANTAANSPQNTNGIDDSDTDALVSPTQPQLSPMLSSSANLMMTALGNDSGGQVMGPPEAFYPSNNFIVESNFEDEDDEDDDSEAALNVDDFIDFGNGSSDEEMGDEIEELASPVLASPGPASLPPTPNHAVEVPQPDGAERLLNHLDRGIVTAFRRNHTRYQTLIRLPHHREFMPANSPSRPASAFRRSKLTDSRTPPRKRKASGYLGGEAVRRKLLDSHRKNTATPS